MENTFSAHQASESDTDFIDDSVCEESFKCVKGLLKTPNLRNRTSVEIKSEDQASESDTEVIDDSVCEESFKCVKGLLKNPYLRNRACVIAESEDSTEDSDKERQEKCQIKKTVRRKSSFSQHVSDDDSDNERQEKCQIKKTVLRKSSFSQHVSDDVKAVAMEKQMEISYSSAVVSSSSEAEISTEIARTINKSSTPFIGKKIRKRMILFDSDTYNSIIIDTNRKEKILCHKETPLKIDTYKSSLAQQNDGSFVNDKTSDNDDESEDEVDETSNTNLNKSNNSDLVDDTDDKKEHSAGHFHIRNTNEETDKTHDELDLIDEETDQSSDKGDQDTDTDEETGKSDDELELNVKQTDQSSDKSNRGKVKVKEINDGIVHNNDVNDYVNDNDVQSHDSYKHNTDESDECDEIEMVISRATRMSIFGVIPKDAVADSDDSDLILSDESNLKSKSSYGSTNSLSELPDVNSIRIANDNYETKASKPNTPQRGNLDSSSITCLPFSNPNSDGPNRTVEDDEILDILKEKSTNIINTIQNEDKNLLRKSTGFKEESKEMDDDVSILACKPEIITLSSDNEDECNLKSKSSYGSTKSLSELPDVSSIRNLNEKYETKMSKPNTPQKGNDEAAETSPEIVRTINKTSTPFIGNKFRKRMILFDSDTDISIIIDTNRKEKILCRKETPLKIDTYKNSLAQQNDGSFVYDKTSDNDDESEDEVDETSNSNLNKSNNSDLVDDIGHFHISNSNEETDKTHDELDLIDEEADQSSDKGDQDTDTDEKTDKSDDELDLNDNKTDQSSDRGNQGKVKVKEINDGIVHNNDVNDYVNDNDVQSHDSYKHNTDESDECDEIEMVMSRATRMSIFGVIPKDAFADNDDSDLILSDESNLKSKSSYGSTDSLSELPDVNSIRNDKHASKPNTPQKSNLDSSSITCLPFSNPNSDSPNRTVEDDEILDILKEKSTNVINTIQNEDKNLLRKSTGFKEESKEIDDDVRILDFKPEIITLSSDNEDELKQDKSPKPTKSRKSKKSPKFDSNEEPDNVIEIKEGNIKNYMLPPSYPNQVVYVRKSVKDTEISKWNATKADLEGVKKMIENMNLEVLPDGGAKLMDRMEALEQRMRRQGDRVACMVVETDELARQNLDNKENVGLSWDDIQKATNAVQPRKFGKQAMATHMAERSLILDSLRDLYMSLASRPAESQLAPQPAGLATELMPHQLYALAWLRWREAQRPAGGILADDMGLGKTISIIALILADKKQHIDYYDDDDENGESSTLIRGGTLVVCPASLVQQWAGEVQRHCAPHAMSHLIHHGTARAAHPSRLAPYDVVITTYSLLQKEEGKSGVLKRVRWRRVVLDEAHVIRNHKSCTSRAVSAVSAGRRWALTGTPVRNKDLDLYALLKFLHCTPFDDLTMWKKWIDSKSIGGQERMSTIMNCILLRRTKQLLHQRGQLTGLPQRTAHHQLVTLTKDEMNVYQRNS